MATLLVAMGHPRAGGWLRPLGTTRRAARRATELDAVEEVQLSRVYLGTSWECSQVRAWRCSWGSAGTVLRLNLRQHID